jgi:Zn-dependent peptidase ImmA (M78 family)
MNVALPDWWDDSLAENPAGFAQCLLILSRFLGLDLKSLQDAKSPLRLRDFGICKYKKREGTSDDDLVLSRVIATRAAQLAGAAMETSYKPIPSASEIRQAILEHSRWVGFKGLINYCWSRGIPVLHVNYFPTGAKRPDGFTLRLNGRPVIVLCRNEKQPSWLLFILAHELGHIGSGHIPENGALLDEQIENNEPDQEEKEADQFALELLTGNPKTTISVDGRWPNAENLAEFAKVYGRRNHVDPGHVILNYAHSMGPSFFAVARGALKILHPDVDAMQIVRDKLAKNLDWELLPEDSSEFLMRITRQSQESDE